MKIMFWGGVPLTCKIGIKKAFGRAAKVLNLPNEIEATLGFVSQTEMREINQRTRKIDSATDVLSFPAQDLQKKPISEYMKSFPREINPDTGNLPLGDIVICQEIAKKQADEIGQSLKDELVFLSIHGFLHLLGFDHIEKVDEEEMTTLQKRILQR